MIVFTSETDSAVTVHRYRTRQLAPASETDSARPIGRQKTFSITVALEVDTAGTVVFTAPFLPDTTPPTGAVLQRWSRGAEVAERATTAGPSERLTTASVFPLPRSMVVVEAPPTTAATATTRTTRVVVETRMTTSGIVERDTIARGDGRVSSIEVVL
jgi:hypothetical protein